MWISENYALEVTSGMGGACLDCVLQAPRLATSRFHRVNENPGLLALHGLWVLEHNRLCDELSTSNPAWNDERLFNEARKLVIAYMQHITATEYLPILLGEPLPGYSGYSSNVNAAPDVIFAAAAYRYGHSGINTQFW